MLPDLAIHPTPQDPPLHEQGAGRPGELRLLTQWEAIQGVARGLSKKEACAELHRRFPDRTHTWFCRNFARLMAMSVDDFAGEIGDHRFHGEPLSPNDRVAMSGGAVDG